MVEDEAMTKRLGKGAVVLAAVVLGAMSGAAGGMDGSEWVRRAAEDAQEERARAERVMRAERAHARMPDTMYASTPSVGVAPHPFSLEAVPEQSSPVAPVVLGRRGGGVGARVGWLPSAGRWESEGVKGVLRLVNRAGASGEVRIEAWDDAGVMYGPLVLSLGGYEAVELDSGELEGGAPGKGLSGATGEGEGDWRLEVTSALDVGVVVYGRTREGVVSALHDRVERSGMGHGVELFNAGRSVHQASALRVVNSGAEDAAVRIEGMDDGGAWSSGVVEFGLGGGMSRTLTAQQLETGEGLSGGLGEGEGRWRLEVSADRSIEVLHLVTSAAGVVSNVSTVAAVEWGEGGAVHRLGWLPSSARGQREGVRGFVRVVNRAGESGEVRIEAWDDAGVEYGPLVLSLGGDEAVELSVEELEGGASGKGLSGATGEGEGDWRLRLSTALELAVGGVCAECRGWAVERARCGGEQWSGASGGVAVVGEPAAVGQRWRGGCGGPHRGH